MKKHGFTLAEVLVTLGIIGVVAALTTPALIQNVGNAKVGPKLQKAKATFETAAEMMLTDQNANSLFGISSDASKLGEALGRYMKIVAEGDSMDDVIGYSSYTSGSNIYSSHMPEQMGKRFNAEDGMIYYIKLLETKEGVDTVTYADIPNNQRIGQVFVDINGKDKPNTVAKDLFVFALYNDGTLRPWGGKGFRRHHGSAVTEEWTGSTATCNKDHVKGNGETCTGSIFDNNMKIIYQ